MCLKLQTKSCMWPVPEKASLTCQTFTKKKQRIVILDNHKVQSASFRKCATDIGLAMLKIHDDTDSMKKRLLYRFSTFRHLWKVLMFTILAGVLSVSNPVFSQSGDDYIHALQLMRQGNHEEAYTILFRLYQLNPNNYPVFDELLNSLINLKRYDEAITLANRQLRGNYQDIVLATRLAEIYHLDNQRDMAIQMWQRTLDANMTVLQAYRFVADRMTSRREFELAIDVYLRARRQFNNQTLFFIELSSAYMALNRRAETVENLLSVLIHSPGNSGFVLRHIIGYDDRVLTELTIVELDEKSRTLPAGSQELSAFREVLTGLLMEQRLFRRALTSTRAYEMSAPEGQYPLYALVGRLRSQNEFQLADEALEFYVSRPDHPLYVRSMEDRAVLYMTWSRYLTEFNLDYGNLVHKLNADTRRYLDKIISDHPTYQRYVEVLSLKAELTLDQTGDTDLVESLISTVRSRAVTNEHRIIAGYLEGRLHMFKGQHAMARISLTRANREARIGELAEKTRYYLALNDFYAGDFEFASIQMRALERLTTSYYANDALRLRVWMREGINNGNPTEELKMFSRARFLFDTHQKKDAVELLMPLITSNHGVPLKGDAILMTVAYLRTTSPIIAYHIIDQGIIAYRGALKERLLWERVRIADGIAAKNDLLDVTVVPDKAESILVWIRQKIGNNVLVSDVPDTEIERNETFLNMLKQKIPTTTSDRYQLYEDMIFEFPLGFYAPQVRSRLTELQARLPS